MRRLLLPIITGCLLFASSCFAKHRFSDASFRPGTEPSSPTVQGVTLRLVGIALSQHSFEAYITLENETDKPFPLRAELPFELQLCGFTTLPQINLDQYQNSYKVRHMPPSPLEVPAQGKLKVRLTTRNSGFGPKINYDNSRDQEKWAVIAHPDLGLKASDLLVRGQDVPASATAPTP